MTATPQDLAAIDRLIAPPGPPERIYGWLDTQLSIARHYGGIQVQGVRFIVDYEADGNPLVRHDIFAKEQREKLEANRLARRAKFAAEKSRAKKQGALL